MYEPRLGSQFEDLTVTVENSKIIAQIPCSGPQKQVDLKYATRKRNHSLDLCALYNFRKLQENILKDRTENQERGTRNGEYPK